MGLYYLFWRAAKHKYVKLWCFTKALLNARKGKEDLSVFHLAVLYVHTVAISAQQSCPHPPNFLVCAVFFCGDPKTCCRKKGTASLAQFVLQKEGSFSRSPMLQLIWWKELCVLLSCPTKYFRPLIQTSHLEMAQALPKCVSFTKVVQEILTREHLFAVVTH